MTDLCLLYSPFPSLESARSAAQAVLGEKLAACCNLLPGLESHYRWEGELTQSAEVILLAKTTPALAVALRERLGGLHPYACPAILTLPAGANAVFSAWVAAQTLS